VIHFLCSERLNKAEGLDVLWARTQRVSSPHLYSPTPLIETNYQKNDIRKNNFWKFKFKFLKKLEGNFNIF
jgi:hypothetical protein